MPVDEPLDDRGRTSLLCFAEKMNRAGMELMIKLDASLSSTDKPGRTILHYLAQPEGGEVHISWLLSLGRNDLNVNAETRGGETPLMFAAKWNRENIVKELLKAGANPLLKNCLD